MMGSGVALTAAAMMIAVPSIASDTLLLAPDESRVVSEPSVAVDDRGAMVVAWSSHVSAGAQPLNGIRFQRFRRDGMAAGVVFRIDALPGDLAAKPAVGIAPDGSRFVVVWEGGADGKRTKRRIWARVFDSAGRPVGEEIRVDQIRMTHERWGLPREYFGDPKISVAPDGGFVVVWRSEGKSSCDRFNISARRFSPFGEPLGDEFIVNTERRWSQLNPEVDHDDSGGFVVVWQDGRFIGTDDEWSSIRGRVFAAGGGDGGDEFTLSPADGEVAAAPSLAVAGDGSFACAWKTGNGDEPLSRLRAGVYAANGTVFGRVIGIQPEHPGTGRPHLTLVGPTGFMVVWAGVAEDRFGSPAVMAQSFNFIGAPTTDIFPLSPATCWGVDTPEVAASRGVGAVVWKSPLNDGIIVRRFSSGSPTTDAPLSGGGRTFHELVATGRAILADTSADLEKRGSALDFLSCMRGVAGPAVGDLQRCLSSEENESSLDKAACSFALASVAESVEQALPSLLAVLRDAEEDSRVRAAAACAIGLFGKDGAAAVPTLVSALQDDDGRVRGCAGKSLGQIRAYGAVDAVVAALEQGEPVPFGSELHQNLIRGLGELADNKTALEAIQRYVGACDGLREYLGTDLEISDLGDPDGLDRYFRHTFRHRRRYGPDQVRRMIEDARYRLEEGRVGIPEGGWDSDTGNYYSNLDRTIRKFVGIRNLGRVGTCDCTLAVARGISELDPMPESVVRMYSGLLEKAGPLGCLSELLLLTRRMGSGGAPAVNGLLSLLRQKNVPARWVIPVLAATDPSCKYCVVALREHLADQAPDVREAAVDGLIEAGPRVIRAAKLELTGLLDDESAEVRERAEEALDLIEAETEVCDLDWQPADGSAAPPVPTYPAVRHPYGAPRRTEINPE